jgi:hypothetical protein
MTQQYNDNDDAAIAVDKEGNERQGHQKYNYQPLQGGGCYGNNKKIDQMRGTRQQ